MPTTRAVDYGVRLMTCLAQAPARRQSVAELAHAAEVPAPQAARLLQALVRGRLVDSRRGRFGGFKLARGPATISVLDIVRALEGPARLSAPADASGRERRAWGGAYRVWADAQRRANEVLARASLAELIESTPESAANGGR